MRPKGRVWAGVLAAMTVFGSLAVAGTGAISKQIGAADAALLFGGADAEGGVGDWYLSNGVVEAVIDDAGPTPDLIGVVPPANVPPINSSAAPTGGNLLDLGL